MRGNRVSKRKEPRDGNAEGCRHPWQVGADRHRGIAWLLMMVWDFLVYLAFVKKVADEYGDEDYYEPPKEYDAPEDH